MGQKAAEKKLQPLKRNVHMLWRVDVLLLTWLAIMSQPLKKNVEIGRRIAIWGNHDVSMNETLAHGEHMNIA